MSAVYHQTNFYVPVVIITATGIGESCTGGPSGCTWHGQPNAPAPNSSLCQCVDDKKTSSLPRTTQHHRASWRHFQGANSISWKLHDALSCDDRAVVDGCWLHRCINSCSCMHANVLFCLTLCSRDCDCVLHGHCACDAALQDRQTHVPSSRWELMDAQMESQDWMSEELAPYLWVCSTCSCAMSSSCVRNATC
jgi:hypothetical protein